MFDKILINAVALTAGLLIGGFFVLAVAGF